MMAYIPKPGFIRNPLLAFPRNELCPCKSGKKFKKCHLPVLPWYIEDPKLLRAKAIEAAAAEAAKKAPPKAENENTRTESSS